MPPPLAYTPGTTVAPAAGLAPPLLLLLALAATAYSAVAAAFLGNFHLTTCVLVRLCLMCVRACV